jgi:hypothetical protein
VLRRRRGSCDGAHPPATHSGRGPRGTDSTPDRPRRSWRGTDLYWSDARLVSAVLPAVRSFSKRPTPRAKCLFYALPKLLRDRFEHADVHPAGPALFDIPDRRHEPGLIQTIMDVFDDVAVRRHCAMVAATASDLQSHLPLRGTELNRPGTAGSSESGGDERGC